LDDFIYSIKIIYEMKVNLLKVLGVGFKIENAGNRFNIIEILYALSMPWG